MRFLKKIPYKLKTALPMLALAGGTMMTSCKKEEPEMPVTPTIDVEVKISLTDVQSLFLEQYNMDRKPSELINYYINNPEIRNIYIVPEKNTFWSVCSASNIISLKQKTLIPALNFSPKIRGKGDFNFMPGEASKVPNDSLWYIENGWTINKDLQKQR